MARMGTLSHKTALTLRKARVKSVAGRWGRAGQWQGTQPGRLAGVQTGPLSAEESAARVVYGSGRGAMLVP